MKRYDTAKLAMSVFIASEGVFFAFLIAAYVYYSGAVVRGPQASNSLNVSRTLVFTMCLIASSGTIWAAERHLRTNRGAFRLWLGATIALGITFLGGQTIEYIGLIQKGVTPERNLFGATFFTLTGLHGLHVFCGVASLAVIFALTFSPRFGQKDQSGFGAIALYWHFVDAVWIVIFSLVYISIRL